MTRQRSRTSRRTRSSITSPAGAAKTQCARSWTTCCARGISSGPWVASLARARSGSRRHCARSSASGAEPQTRSPAFLALERHAEARDDDDSIGILDPRSGVWHSTNPRSQPLHRNIRAGAPATHSPRALALFVLAVLLLLSTPVAAENEEGAFTFSAFAGGQGFPFAGKTHYDADFDWGVRAGYNFSSRLGVELMFGANKTVHDPEAQRCDIYQYGTDVLYFFRPEKKLVPFLAAGLGALDVRFHGTYDGTHSLSDETIAYANVGVGLEYGLTSWLGLRADFREAVMLNGGDQFMQGVLGFRLQR